MKELVIGDILELASLIDFLVIPTNIGWDSRGYAVMGAGLAKFASSDDPTLFSWYGRYCQQHGADTPVVQRGRFILFPTKPLDVVRPWMSWSRPASLKLVKRSLKQLSQMRPPDKRIKFFVPMVGCGVRTGMLDPSDVLPLMTKYLRKSWFVLVKQPD
jgi:hypothetical protein